MTTNPHPAICLGLLVVLLGCKPERAGDIDINTRCDVDQSARSETHLCLVECTKAGNPMSDEEGEDLVAQCASSCAGIYCEERHEFERDGRVRDCRPGIPQPYFDACVQARWRP